MDNTHDDVIKWKHFPCNWPFVREIHRSPVNFPHKGQWRGALMFSLIYAWINDWVNNRQAGDLRRQHSHYDVIVMLGILCHRWIAQFSPMAHCTQISFSYQPQIWEQNVPKDVLALTGRPSPRKFHGKISHSMETLHKFIVHRGLTDCGSVKPHGVIYQGQHWLKPWNATWRRQATIHNSILMFHQWRPASSRQSARNFSSIWINIRDLVSILCIWKCRLLNGSHFIQTSICYLVNVML